MRENEVRIGIDEHEFIVVGDQHFLARGDWGMVGQVDGVVRFVLPL